MSIRLVSAITLGLMVQHVEAGERTKAILPSETKAAPTTEAGKAIIKTYSVADLVIPAPEIGVAPSVLPPKTFEAELIKTITQGVEPKSWSSAGGENQIDYYPLGLALVVSAPASTHRAIEELLKVLRQGDDQQITIAGYFLTINDAGLRACDFRFTDADGTKRALPRTMKMAQFQELMKGLQGEPTTNICQLPRVTALNEQPATVKAGDTEYFVTGVTVAPKNGTLKATPQTVRHDLGMMFCVKPSLVAGGKQIDLAIEASVREHGCLPVPSHTLRLPVAGSGTAEVDQASLGGALNQLIQEPKIITRSVKTTTKIGNDEVLLLYAGKATIERMERDSLPMLDKVPVVSALFTRDRPNATTNHLILAVHAKRIVIEDESNKKAAAELSSKLGQLLRQYQECCAQGKVDEARRLAIECLAIDPTCFSKANVGR